MLTRKVDELIESRARMIISREATVKRDHPEEVKRAFQE